MKKQTYKLEVPIKWKIQDVFHVSLLKQNTIIKRQVNQNDTIPELKKEFKTKDDKKYEVKAIINSIMYGKEVNNQLPNFYYHVL